MKEDLAVALTVLFFAHYIFDFYCQSDSMAQRKSKSIPALIIHTIVYSIGMWTVLGFTEFYLYGKASENIGIALLILMFSHFAIDYITSRLNSMFWEKEQRRKFFLCLGFDQFLHQVIIIIIFLVI
jgi:membrane-bound metal-dependent hydrolase YbcI (DUF457 family)